MATHCDTGLERRTRVCREDRTHSTLSKRQASGQARGAKRQRHSAPAGTTERPTEAGRVSEPAPKKAHTPQ